MLNPNEYNSEPPVNQIPNFSINLYNTSSNQSASTSIHNRNQSNRYYMLANLSPSTSFYNSNDDSIQPHNRNGVSTNKTRNISRSNINNAVISNHQAYLHSIQNESENRNNSEFSPVNNRLDFDSSDNNDFVSTGAASVESNHHSLRILRNYNNDTNDQILGESNETHSTSTSKNNDIIQSILERNNSAGLEPECLTPYNEELPFNWQASKSSIRERIASMFNNTALSDVVFVVGPLGTARRVPGHQFILAISSVVFDAMFYGPLAAKKSKSASTSSLNNCYNYVTVARNIEKETEARSTGEMQDLTYNGDGGNVDRSVLEIAVPDVEPVAFLALLKFIYTDEVHIDPDTVMTTLYAAKKYSVPSLEKACVDYLRLNLSSDNAFMLLTQARLFNEIQLANQCLDVIDKNTTDSLTAEGFLDIDQETLCNVLDRDTLGIREIKLFEAVLRWATHQAAKEDPQSQQDSSEEPDAECPEPVKRLLAPVISHIRFPLMSPDDFAAHVARRQLLPDRELVQIFLLYHHAVAAPSLAYLATPRCCLTGREQIINRYPVIEQRWGYSGTSDRIRFMVDRKIFVVGFGLYGSAQGPAEYQALIEILQQDTGSVVATNFLTFKCDGTNSIFHVRFKEPVEVLPNASYIACATLKGPDSYYGSIGYQKVIHESATHGKVTFQFYYAAGNNNGTSVEDGQIPQIVFFM